MVDQNNEAMNPCPEWIHRFIWSTMVRVISDHWSWPRSSQTNAPLVVVSIVPILETVNCNRLVTIYRQMTVSQRWLQHFFSYFSRHLLVVFGGLKGLEASLESDEKLTENDPSLVFDHYINTCPGQGSGTIRTEEAILVTMSALRPVITKATRWKSGIWSDLRSTWKSLEVRVPLFLIHAPALESLTVSGCFAQKWIRQRAVRPDLIRFAWCASFFLLCLFSFSSPGLFPEKVGEENPWKRSPRCKVFLCHRVSNHI